MALSRFDGVAFTTTGGIAVAAGAAIEVRVESTSALASIFEDRDGLTGITQPGFEADDDGAFFFYAAGIAEGYSVQSTSGAEVRLLNHQALGTAREFDIDEFWRSVLAAATTAAARLALGFAAIAAKGDSWWGTAADTIGKLTVGANDSVLVADSAQATGSKWQPKAEMSAALMRGYIAGLVMSNNGTDAAHDIDISAGVATDDSNAIVMSLASALTKQIDAAWAVGTDQGGLDGTESVAGTPDADTWYYVHLIRRSDTGVVDALFSESATSPTMPTNYDERRLIGAVLTDGTANIIAFKVYETSGGIRCIWGALSADFNSTIGTTASLITVRVPPIDGVIAELNMHAVKAATVIEILISSPDFPDTAPDGPNVAGSANLGSQSAAGSALAQLAQMFISTVGGQIRARADQATVTLVMGTLSWEWSRR
jgi:hypothetical protein